MHFFTSDVKTACAPSLVLDAVPTLVFVKRLSVEFVKTVCILCEVRRNPIEDNANACFVHGIDKCHKVLGTAVT